MKRLLNLLTAIALIGSTSATVVACGEDAPAPPPAPPIKKETAEDIAKKIRNRRIPLAAYTNPNLAAQATISLLKADLQKLNTALTHFDLAAMTFSLADSNKPLEDNGTENPVGVNADITVGTGDEETKATVLLMVSINTNAEQILTKISMKKLEINYVADDDVTSDATTEVLKAKLQAENPNLLQTDLSHISFLSGTLNNDGSETASPIRMAVTVADHVATTVLDVKVDANADQIKNKIDSSLNYSVYSTTANLHDIKSRDDMRKILQKLNPSLTTYDLNQITFEDKVIPLETPTSVIVSINDSQSKQPVTVTINVTRVTKDQETVNNIKAKIKNTTLALDPNLPKSTSNGDTVRALKSQLVTLNPTLDDEDLKAIKFNTVTLELNKQVNVTATITSKLVSEDVILKVELASVSIKVANKITKTQLYLKAGTATSLTNSNTITELKQTLLKANSTLTAPEMAMITFSLKDASSPLVADGSETNTTVNAVITNSAIVGDVTNKELQVAIRPSAVQIKAKISTVSVDVPVGTNTDPTNPATASTIIRTIALANNLKAYDQTQISVASGATLVTNTAQVVVLSIKDDATVPGSETINTNITLVNEVQTISDKITDTNLTVPFNVNASTANTDTQKAITTVLMKDNNTLTVPETRLFAYSTVTLDKTGTSTPTVVVLSITKGAVTVNVNLSVIVETSATQIANKITDVNIEISDSNNLSTGDAGTITAMKNSLRYDNTQLTANDLTKITFETKNLVANVPTAVILYVEQAGTIISKTITVNRVNQAQYIIDKISSRNIDIQSHSNIDPALTATADKIKAGLAKTSPLTSSDLADISISKASAGAAGNLNNEGKHIYKAVTVTANADGQSATKNVNVAINTTAQQFWDLAISKFSYIVPFSPITPANWMLARIYMYSEFEISGSYPFVWLSDMDMVTWSNNNQSISAFTNVSLTIIDDNMVTKTGSVYFSTS